MTEKELRAGDYVTTGVRLLRPLAEGGMGRVWVAEHLGLRCEVVVKLMTAGMIAREDGVARFAREAEVAAAIKSPHVVQVFDHGVTAEHGVPYIVMELLDGKDLGVVLHERGRLEPSETVAVIVQIGRALTKAHKVGIIHRDIKPENIFLSEEAGALHAKLLDFGTAKQTQSTHREAKQTMPGEIMGTPYYMSPEQSVGALVDERTDIWSLAVVAFEALTGTKPFEGSNVGSIALAIHGPLPRISDRASDLPPELDAWFARACSQVPQDRFATVRDMTNAFVEALTGAAPPVEQTESICLVPPRRISVRPQDADDMKKTMPTSFEVAVDAASLRPPAPSADLDSIAPLAATLPDRSAVHRPTKIAAGVVGIAAAALMAAIVMHQPASKTTTVAAAPPPPAAVAPPPEAREDIPPPPPVVADPPPAPAKKTAAKKPHATKKKSAASDDDLVKLIEAGRPEAPAPEAAKPEPPKPEAPKPEAPKPDLPGL